MTARPPFGVELACLRDGGIAGRGHILDKANGELGIGRKLLQPNEQTELFQISAENQAEPLLITAALDVVADRSAVDVGATGEARLQMVLKWGVQRGINEAIVDYRAGAVVTLTANRLNISARYIVPAPELAHPLLVGASVGYGVRPATVMPANTFTDDLGPALAPATEGAARLIPAYATGVAWVSPADPAAAPAAQLRFRTNELAGAFLVGAVAPLSMQFVPIPNGARFVRVTNTSAAPTAFRLLYELAL